MPVNRTFLALAAALYLVAPVATGPSTRILNGPTSGNLTTVGTTFDTATFNSNLSPAGAIRGNLAGNSCVYTIDFNRSARMPGSTITGAVIDVGVTMPNINVLSPSKTQSIDSVLAGSAQLTVMLGQTFLSAALIDGTANNASALQLAASDFLGRRRCLVKRWVPALEEKYSQRMLARSWSAGTGERCPFPARRDASS
jgi:hypothetical protein